MQPLHLAARTGNLRRLRKLVREPGIDLDASDDLGQTALFVAGYQGHTDCLKVLREAGAAAWLLDRNGRTPAALARSYKENATADLLDSYEQEDYAQEAEQRDISVEQLAASRTEAVLRGVSLDDLDLKSDCAAADECGLELAAYYRDQRTAAQHGASSVLEYHAGLAEASRLGLGGGYDQLAGVSQIARRFGVPLEDACSDMHEAEESGISVDELMANRIEAKSIGITTDRLLRDREDAKRHHVSLQQYYALSKRARELDMSLETLQEKKKAARAHRVSLEEYISDEEEAMELGVQGGSLAKLYAAREYAEAHGYDRTLSEGERAELGDRLRGRGAGGAGSGLYIDMPQAILDIEVAAKRGCPVEQIFEDRQLAQANGLHEEQVAADRKEADEQGIAVMQLYAERDEAKMLNLTMDRLRELKKVSVKHGVTASQLLADQDSLRTWMKTVPIPYTRSSVDLSHHTDSLIDAGFTSRHELLQISDQDLEGIKGLEEGGKVSLSYAVRVINLERAKVKSKKQEEAAEATTGANPAFRRGSVLFRSPSKAGLRSGSVSPMHSGHASQSVDGTFGGRAAAAARGETAEDAADPPMRRSSTGNPASGTSSSMTRAGAPLSHTHTNQGTTGSSQHEHTTHGSKSGRRMSMAEAQGNARRMSLSQSMSTKTAVLEAFTDAAGLQRTDVQHRMASIALVTTADGTVTLQQASGSKQRVATIAEEELNKAAPAASASVKKTSFEMPKKDKLVERRRSLIPDIPQERPAPATVAQANAPPVGSRSSRAAPMKKTPRALSAAVPISPALLAKSRQIVFSRLQQGQG